MYTLRLFPSKIDNYIEWARDYFTGYFVNITSDIKKSFIDKRNLIEM